MRALVLHLHFGVDVAQFDDVRLGQVLRRGVGGQLIGARVAGEAGQMRLLHGDLGAGDDQIADVDRQLGEHAQRIEIGDQEDGDDADHHRDRNARCASTRTRRLWRRAARNARSLSPRLMVQ